MRRASRHGAPLPFAPRTTGPIGERPRRSFRRVVTLTNLGWRCSAANLRARFGFEQVRLLNDFGALARGLALLQPGEVRAIGGRREPVATAPLALLGPGTGLGVSGLIRRGARRVSLEGEGGHATLGAVDAVPSRVVELLDEWYGHASAERALSGAGIVNLYRASCAIHGRPFDALRADDITARGLEGSDPSCVDAGEWFLAFLGGVAGDLALTLGARGGVYIAGGIVARLGDWIERSAFRACFEAKGRLRAYLETIPTWMIEDPVATSLRGANDALDDEPH